MVMFGGEQHMVNSFNVLELAVWRVTRPFSLLKQKWVWPARLQLYMHTLYMEQYHSCFVQRCRNWSSLISLLISKYVAALIPILAFIEGLMQPFPLFQSLGAICLRHNENIPVDNCSMITLLL